jgi:hypothetical protein
MVMANLQDVDPPKVFISYAWKNQSVAKQLQRDLQRDGVQVFVDYEKITGGDSLPARISAGLEWCNTLVLLWSEDAAKSYYVSQEWESAFHLQKRIIPCVLDDSALPALLRGRLYLNFSSYDPGYAQLCHTLGVEPKMVTSPTVTPPTTAPVPPQHVDLPSETPTESPQPPSSGKSKRPFLRRTPKPKSLSPATVIKPKRVSPTVYFKDKWTNVRSAAPSWGKRERITIITLGLIVVAVIFLGIKLYCSSPGESSEQGTSLQKSSIVDSLAALNETKPTSTRQNNLTAE